MEPVSADGWVIATVDRSQVAAEFDDVVREYWPRVFRFALVSLRDRGAAEGIAQDTFMKAFQAWGRFRGESSVGTWLMQIALNQIRDYSRNQRLRFWKRTMQSDADAMGDLIADKRLSPEMDAAAKQRVAAVWRAASSLPERQRTVFLLRFVEDMDLLEIAAATGLKEGTVKAHLFRALQAVRARTADLK